MGETLNIGKENATLSNNVTVDNTTGSAKYSCAGVFAASLNVYYGQLISKSGNVGCEESLEVGRIQTSGLEIYGSTHFYGGTTKVYSGIVQVATTSQAK